MKLSILVHLDGFYNIFSGFTIHQQFWKKKIHFFENLANIFHVFQNLENPRWQFGRPIKFYVILCKEIGCNLKVESRRTILVDPYFASKSPGHAVTLTSFAASLWWVRNSYLHIGCKIVGRKATASFALLASLVWQISRQTGGGGG